MRPLILPALISLAHSALSLSAMGYFIDWPPTPGIIGLTLWFWLGFGLGCWLYERIKTFTAATSRA